MRILDRIKQLVRLGDYRFTEKALDEMDLDGLLETDVIEAILNANRIDKVLTPERSPNRELNLEKLYVIKDQSQDGTPIYTKGVNRRQATQEIYYILISSKIDRAST